MSARPTDPRPSSFSSLLATVLLASLGLALPGAAFAETFLDAMGGIAFSQEGEFDLGSVGMSRNDDEEPDDSFAVGLRFGHFFDQLPQVGVALDVSYFEPNIEQTSGANIFDLRVIPISFLAIARLPIGITKNLPNGRLQPYVAAGPSLFLTDVNGQSGFEDVGADIGADVRGGLNFAFMGGFGMFVEYRFSYSKVSFDDAFTTPAGKVSANAEVELLTHHMLAGLRMGF